MRRAKYSDIAEWFLLDRYDYILNLSVRHVICEVLAMSYNRDFSVYNKDQQFAVFPFPLIVDISRWDECVDKGQISGDDRGILPLSFANVCAFVNSCLLDGRMSINEAGVLEARADIDNHDIHTQPMMYDVDDPSSNGVTGVFVDVGLELMSDAEMIAGFKILLRKWREQTGIPERASEERGRFGLSTIAKIQHYKVIPYLDISRWAEANGVMVSNELYARLLFPAPLPNGEVKGGAHIRDTVKPFAESARDLLSRIKLKLYFSDNPHIEDMKFSDFLALEDFQ